MSQAGYISSTTGTVNPSGGGTGVVNPPAHTIAVAEGSAPFNFVGPGTIGQILQSNGASSDPSFVSTLSGLVQGNITTLGTIGSGTWQGTPIGQSFGGSGQNNFSGNMVLIQSQTAASSTALTFTTGVTGYDVYFLLFYGVTVSVNNAFMLMQFSTNGGGSYSSTGYTTNGYLAFGASLQNRMETEAGCVIGDNISNPTNAPNIPAWGNTYIYHLANASFFKQTFSTFGANIASTGDGIGIGSVCNLWSTATVVNAFQIIPSSGNITTGTFKLFGMVN